MELSGVTSLPLTGVGTTAAMAAMSGHVMVALLLASLCAFTTGLLMLQRDHEGELDEDILTP